MKKLQELGKVLSIEEQKRIIGGLAILSCGKENDPCDPENESSCCANLICIGCSETAHCEKDGGGHCD